MKKRQKEKKIIRGRLSLHIRGFGFIRSEDKNIADIFVFNDNINTAMHNDEVVGEIIKDGNRKIEAKIIEIVKRANERIVGTLKISGENANFAFVVPDETRIINDVYIPKGGFNKASDRHKVIVKITKWPTALKRNLEGVIVEDLGHRSDVGVDILSIVRKYNLSEKFPEEVEKSAHKIREEIPQNEIKKRKDLRNEIIVTIDGADAKDLDDAVSLKVLPNGNYLLGVHIADVSHYVQEDSVLDKEAFNRATSVYLPDRVIPMLPKKLSDGVCSLNPKEDKLTLSVDMEINSKGNVISRHFYESIIRTKERMIYDDISDILEKNNKYLREKYSKLLLDNFLLMEKLSKILKKRREDKGSIDFDLPELKLTLNDKGEPIKIEKKERRIANKIIEEFMILCNETIAALFYKIKIPFIYRIHQPPSFDKIQILSKFAKKFGHHLRDSKDSKGSLKKISSRKMQELLAKTEGKEEEKIINLLVFRAMEKAEYSSNNIGHFGLDSENYSHFTSPIRRYPDLQIHRIIKLFISKQLTAEKRRELKNRVEIVAFNSSKQEEVAMEAEREAEKLKITQYMSYHIGEKFKGTIIDITSFGLFVELENGVHGLVRIGSITDDYYIYDEQNLLIFGKKKKKTYKIGDTVIVKVEKADIDEKKIDFVLA